MHIPDGYLSPQTCAIAFAAAVPVWAVATRRVERVVKTRHIPALAAFSSVSFLVMMLNVPIPDGTTAHAVGAVIIAITLGPWAAVLAVSIALLFQALLFGDGGVLALGANSLNMAIIMTFIGLGTYRLIAGRSELTARRRVIAAAIGGYVGINASALAAAIELGLQPVFFHSTNGTPLYSPYHLWQTIPAMALAHLTVAGGAEAILTGSVFAYLARTNPELLLANHPGLDAEGHTIRPAYKGWFTPGRAALGAIGLMVLATPLGLLAPGGAFGEDAPGQLNLHQLGLSSVPVGLSRWNGFWNHTLLGGYGFSTGNHQVLGYLLSAVIGIAVVGASVFGVGSLIKRLTTTAAK